VSDTLVFRISDAEKETLDAWLEEHKPTYFYGVPDSGHTLPGHLFGGSFFGPRWLTGGTVGPEGSILLTLLLVLFWLCISAWLPKIHHPPGA
jgi:hypothetical protein